ncbi:hypothetical protein C8Q80DRAFT_1121587 [Daedaleopsis nitida]|nr:hypothetical protein C8Q80DRAFT_1121587 [Daedaleopsis nitida]
MTFYSSSSTDIEVIDDTDPRVAYTGAQDAWEPFVVDGVSWHGQVTSDAQARLNFTGSSRVATCTGVGIAAVRYVKDAGYRQPPLCMRCEVDGTTMPPYSATPTTAFDTLTFCATTGLPSQQHRLRIFCAENADIETNFWLDSFVVTTDPSAPTSTTSSGSAASTNARGTATTGASVTPTAPSSGLPTAGSDAHGHKANLGAVVGGVVAGVAVLLALAVGCCLVCRRRSRRRDSMEEGMLQVATAYTQPLADSLVTRSKAKEASSAASPGDDSTSVLTNMADIQTALGGESQRDGPGPAPQDPSEGTGTGADKPGSSPRRAGQSLRSTGESSSRSDHRSERNDPRQPRRPLPFRLRLRILGGGGDRSRSRDGRCLLLIPKTSLRNVNRLFILYAFFGIDMNLRAD